MKVSLVRSLWLIPLSVLAGTGLFPAGAQAETARERGNVLFHQCAACHTIEKDAEVTIGPNLWGTYGRKAASKEDFAYSSALAKSGLLWDDATLDRWLVGPSKLVPRTVMAYPGMKDPADRRAIIAYLKVMGP